MVIKYDAEIKDEAILANIDRITNQIFKLLPNFKTYAIFPGFNYLSIYLHPNFNICFTRINLHFY